MRNPHTGVEYRISVTDLLGHEIHTGTIDAREAGSQDRARDAAMALAERVGRQFKDTRVIVWGRKLLPSYTTQWRAYEGTNRNGEFSAEWLDQSDYLNA